MLFVLLEVCAYVCVSQKENGMGVDQVFLCYHHLMSPGEEGGQDDGNVLGDLTDLCKHRTTEGRVVAHAQTGRFT